MRPAAMVKDLKHDPATLRMNGLGDSAPTGNLLCRIDAGHLRIAVSVSADGRRFGNDQTRRGSLRIVFSADGKGTPPGPARMRVSAGITIRLGNDSAPSCSGSKSESVDMARFPVECGREPKTRGRAMSPVDHWLKLS